MPAMIDRDWNIVLPKGESFGFVLRNYGTARADESTLARMAVCDKYGEVKLSKEVGADEDGAFRIQIEPADTMDMAEGVYMYDVTIEQRTEAEGGEPTVTARHTIFAPQMRKFVIGRVADDGV